MFIRTTSRINKDGSKVHYVQLAHNYRDKKSGQSRTKILYNFGREEYIDKDALKRLIDSINRYLGPEEALAGKASEIFKFISSRPLGGAFFLDGLWERLSFKEILETLLKERKYTTPVERALFALVANRALNPGSKLAVERWVKEEVVIPGLEEIAV